MRNNERYHDKWKGIGALSDHQWNVFLHTRALTGMTDAETLVRNEARHMELAEWLVHWAPELDSRARCAARPSSMMHVIH